MLSPLNTDNSLANWDFWLALEKYCAGPLRHALGFPDAIHLRCCVKGESAKSVARDLRLDPHQVLGAAKIFAHGKFSPERLACVVMLDHGMEDEDIAEIFGRSVRWARVVREQRREIEAEEPIPEDLMWFDPELQRDHPSPGEIEIRARDVRENGVPRDSIARCKWKAARRSKEYAPLVSAGAA